MTSSIYRIWAAAAILTLCACSSAPSAQDRIEQTQRDAMAPLKTQYPDVVMGFDFHGTTCDISVDVNNEMQMDDDKEAAMRKQGVGMWRAAWMKAHPGQHAQLLARFLDFRANVVWKGTTKA